MPYKEVQRIRNRERGLPFTPIEQVLDNNTGEWVDILNPPPESEQDKAKQGIFTWLCLYDWGVANNSEGLELLNWRVTSDTDKVSLMLRRLQYYDDDYKTVKGYMYHPENKFRVNFRDFVFSTHDATLRVGDKYRVTLSRLDSCSILITYLGWVLVRLNFGSKNAVHFIVQKL